MHHRDSIARPRKLLAVILSLAFVHAACTVYKEDEDAGPNPAVYEWNPFGCDAEDVQLSAGELFEDLDELHQCQGAGTVHNVLHLEGTVNPFVTIDFNSERQLFEAIVSCAFELDDDLPEPEVARCSATVDYPQFFFYVFGDDPIAPQARALESVLGGIASSSATATIQCPNDPTPVDLAMNEQAVALSALPLANGSCDVQITLESEVVAAGVAYHTVSVVVGLPGDFCGTSSACGGDTPHCGPIGCQAGLEGDACFTPYIPQVDVGDCSEDAPFCVALACQDGGVGDPCVGDYDCADGRVCGAPASPFCEEPGS